MSFHSAKIKRLFGLPIFNDLILCIFGILSSYLYIKEIYIESNQKYSLRMKNYLIFLCWLILISTSCKVSSEVFQDRKEPLSRAPVAVSGKIIEKVDLYDTYTPYLTKYAFKVCDVIKGDTIGMVINLLSRSGKLLNGYVVQSTAGYEFNVGDKSIVLLYPIEPLDSISQIINEMSYGKYKVDYDIPFQYEVSSVIRFKYGRSIYTKPKVRMSKIAKLMKRYLADPNKVVPPMRMRPD
ncbi:MAG: hypothetical protein ACJATI_001998 [Halioglobus sp.]